MKRVACEKSLFEKERVVTADEMAKGEERAIEEGDATPDAYMQKAAEGIVSLAISYIKENNLNKEVALLCARGNNSGDAYAVGERLLEMGFIVKAFQVGKVDASSELCKLHAKKFVDNGGKIFVLEEASEIAIQKDSLIIDGLLGIGCKGALKGLIKEVVEHVNGLENCVLSVDIPSGVCGNTGAVETVAIHANLTAYMGVVKVGHLFNQGYEHVGKLCRVDFGMSSSYVEKMQPFCFLVDCSVIGKALPRHPRKANKYTVGQVSLVAGSLGMPGAAMLAAKASLRSGAGIVRLFHPEEIQAELVNLAPEVIRIALKEDGFDPLIEEMPRTKALLVGSGLGRKHFAKKVLELACQNSEVPLVIDGDGLYFFKQSRSPTVLTPHRGELCHLLSVSTNRDDLELLSLAVTYAKEKDVVIVMKGAPTVVIDPEGKKVVIPYGNVGMASAGMGDALAGVIAALIAQGKQAFDAAVLGVYLHAFAGDLVREEKTSFSMITSDLIETLPLAFLKSGA